MSQKKNYRGLQNQGSTCYMNSLLQNLFMTPEFREKIYQWKFDATKYSEDDSIPLQLQLLFSKLQMQQEKKFIDTKELIKSFQWDASESFQQQDVQEFCRILFDSIEQSCDDQESWIKQIYQGTTENFIKCNKCSNESIREDHFQDLSLTVKNPYENIYNSSLEQALKYYINTEILQGDNKYVCSICQEKVDAVKGTRFKSAPQILQLVLNRFELDFETFQRKKINNTVFFPFVLNFNKFFKNYDDIEVFEYKITPNLTTGKEGRDLYDQVPEFKRLHVRKQSHEDLSAKQETPVQKTKDDLMEKSKPQNREDDTILQKEKLEAMRQDKEIFDKVLGQKNIKVQNSKSPALISGIDEVYDLETDPLFGGGALFEDIQGKVVQEQEADYWKKRDAENKEKQQKADEEESSHESQVKEQIEEYLKEGPDVYYLQAVNIHSGGALGGHYYAYIKNLEDNKWIRFDDSNVTEVSYKEIRNTYGEDAPRYNSGMSAYLLTYRRVLLDENNYQKHFFERITPPPNILEMLQKKQQEEQIKQQIHEQNMREREKDIHLKIFYKKKEKMIVLNREEKMGMLNTLIKVEFDIVESDNNWRLRAYSFYDDIMQESFEGREDKKIEECKLGDFKQYIIEIKEEDQEFDEYDPTKIQLKLNRWTPNIVCLDEISLQPFKIYVKETISLESLFQKISQTLKIPLEKLLVSKRNIGSSDKYTHLLNNESKLKSLLELRLFNSQNLYIEEIQLGESETNWAKEFEMDKYRCIVRYNYPKDKKETEAPIQDYQIGIDNRLRMQELKRKIAELLNLDEDTFLLRKGNRFSNEIRDLSTLISENSMINRGTLFLELGVPSGIDDFKLKFGVGDYSPELSDTIMYDFTEVFEFGVSKVIMVKDLKEKLSKKLRMDKDIDIPACRMRLRERNADKFSQIIHNDQCLSEANLYDKKCFVIQKVEEPDKTNKNQVLICVKQQIENELTKLREFFVDKEMNMNELGVILATAYGIQIENLEACKINTLWQFKKQDLKNNNWLRLNEYTCQVGASPWFLIKDGTLVIIRDKIFSGQDINLIKSQKNNEIQIPQVVKRPYVPEKAIKITVKRKDQEKQENTEQKEEDKDQEFLSQDIEVANAKVNQLEEDQKEEELFNKDLGIGNDQL